MTPHLKASAPAFSSNYCHKCRSSTKHEEKGGSYQCQKCGTLSKMTRGSLYKNPQSKLSFEEKITMIFGEEKVDLLPKSDKLKDGTIEGDKKTSTPGEHRFDDGVPYTQMKQDKQMKHKASQDTLEP